MAQAPSSSIDTRYPKTVRAGQDRTIELRPMVRGEIRGMVAFARSLPPDLARRYTTTIQEEARTGLEEFVKRHELGDVRMLRPSGSAVDQLLELSRKERASLLVCGSRRLSAVERIFEGSTGSMLAANADVPVFVVPQKR